MTSTAALVEEHMRPSLLRRLLIAQEAPAVIVFVVLMIFFSLKAPAQFATVDNLRSITVDFSFLLILAVGMTFVIVTAGIDLSIGAVLVVSSVLADKAMIALSGAGGGGWGTVALGFVAALATGVAWGLFNGLLIAYVGLPPLIVTLGTLGMALAIAQVVTNGIDIAGVPLALTNSLGFGRFLGMPEVFVVALAITAVGGWVLRTTRFGKHTYAIGSSQEAARRAGIAVPRHLTIVYAIMGLLSGFAGFVSLAQFSTTSIGGHTTDNLQVIAGVVLGGTSLFGGIGSIVGSGLGIFIPAILQNGFIIIGVQPYWQGFAIGAVLIGAVYVDRLRRRALQRE
jgi:ribose transport system permease protein